MGWRRRHGRLAVAVVGLVALVAAGCSGGGDEGSGSTTSTAPVVKVYPASVAVFGDSLSQESEPYFKEFLRAADESVQNYYSSQGGTALCDWLDKMREVAATSHPKAVEIEFVGNNLTSCMAGYDLYTQAWLDKYRADTQAALAIWLPTGAHVYLIGKPITRQEAESVPNWDALNRQYEAIAAADPTHITYVPAGSAVEGPNHTYVETLPCLPVEPCTGPVVDGVASNQVRAPDGVHFCPTQGTNGMCDVYASGAYRFAGAMVQALGTPA